MNVKHKRLGVRGALQWWKVPKRPSCPLPDVGLEHDAVAVHVPEPPQRHVGGAAERDRPRVECMMNGRAHRKLPNTYLLTGRIVDTEGVLLDATDTKLLKRQGGVIGRRWRDRHPVARDTKALKLDQLQDRVRQAA